MPSVALVVGIDLGTTHTVVASAPLRAGAEAEVFAIPQLVSSGELAARPLLSSFLFAPVAGEAAADPWGDAPWVIGELARRRGQEVPGRLVSSAKSWLCHSRVDRTAAILPWGSEDEDLPRLSPVEASARILAHVRSAWDAAHPDAPLAEQQVVLTVPASFDEVARELTLRAARAAGLTVRLLEEPQAAFYDALARLGTDALTPLLEERDHALALVVDVGGGTTDLTLIRIERSDGGFALTRVAVGRHLLLGGDNMDLALAHLAESRLGDKKLDPQRFGQLVLACRGAKEALLGAAPPHDAPVTVLGHGSALVGGTLSTRLTRAEVERVVLDGFLPTVAQGAAAGRGRAGLVAFGLPYEHDPAITRHIAQFFQRHAEGENGPHAVLLNGGLFRAERIAHRVTSMLAAWSSSGLTRLPESDPDLAVARGAVAYGLALGGHGIVIGGGSAHGYYLGIEGGRAVCVVPRGAKEGERHVASGRRLALRIGRPVRFELYASDDARVDAAGEVVTLDEERHQRLPPLATSFSAEQTSGAEVTVALEGELSPVGTLELSCVELDAKEPRHFALAFELRGDTPSEAPEDVAKKSLRPGRVSVRPEGPRFDEAQELVLRVFGKSKSDVKERAVKDLWRDLEKTLGERGSWSGELARALFDVVGPLHAARRRSADHERVWWMLAGYTSRPGYGHPLDPQRIRTLSPLFEQGLSFPNEARGWQQFWIAWRRVAGGLAEDLQVRIRDRIDPFLAPPGEGGKKPKGFKPQAHDEMLELSAALEQVPARRRAQLGNWLIERTWNDRNPRLWSAIGRLGARVPIYGSAHNVVPAKEAERWVDHLLREKWDEVRAAPRAARDLARVSGDRARDLSAPVRERVAAELERQGADPEWVRMVRELVAIADSDRAEFFGDELPVGLRLVE
ncbi:MAG: hsp70 family protein [Myxococcales bacterium]|nr:hsp70 family protein [Myxococcales bacterium]